MPNPGDAMWATVVGNAAVNIPWDIAFASPNKVIAAGDFNAFLSSFISFASFSTVTVATPPSSPSIASPYYNGDGAPTCVYDFQSIAVDSDGNFLLTGQFCGTLNFNHGNPNNNLNAPGADGIFVVKLAPDGTHIWSTSFGGPSPVSGNQFGWGIAVDSDKNVVVTGMYSRSFTIVTHSGNTTLGSSGDTGNDIFLMKFSSAGGLNGTGDCIWAKGFTSTAVVQWPGGHAVCVDSSKNIYFTGAFSGTTNFGGSNLVCAGSSTSDPFIVKVDTDGNHLWSTSFPNSGYNCPASPSSPAYARGTKIAVASGVLYVGGHFNGRVTFGTQTLVGQSCEDAFLVSMDPSSHGISWVNTVGSNPGTGPSYDKCHALCVASNGDILMGGYFQGTANLTSGVTIISTLGPSIGAYDGFLIRYKTDGSIVWTKTFGTSDGRLVVCKGVTTDQNSNIWIVLQFRGTLDLGGTAGIISSASTFTANWGIVQLIGGQSISPPNPADFTAVYAPSSNTSFQSKFGFNWTGSLPAGASNILIKYLFPTGTIFPTPNVETTPFLLLNYVSPNLYNGKTAYGFVFKVTGGNGPLWNIPLGYTTIQDWQWAAAWADSTGAQLGSYTAWQHVTRTAAVNLTNDGNIANTPYANLRTTTLQTIKGPMQIVS